jgi:iron complex transport system substrate-binding protein
MNDIERTATEIVDAAVKLHIRVGPGLLESVYETLLGKELARRGLPVERQKRISVRLDGIEFDRAFRIDLLVNGCVAVEIKSVDVLAAAHWKQLLTYLRLADLRLGLLINFSEGRLKDGLKRVVNRYDGFGPSRLRVN